MRRLLLAGLMLAPAMAQADGAYTYQPGLHRDPFAQPEVLKPITPPRACDGGALCAVNINEIRVTAVVSGIAHPVAMIEDAKGEYMIHEGTPIGANGVVTHIRLGSVVVREMIYSTSAPRAIERTLQLDREM